ncbi:hypothetical protein Goari_022199 [Gossypium aridum]|uniref:Uncharacterized protein n=1 Tax=Gossypium aridum TaxID=34290 RepID=A0A7J8YP67_GOSAI|nr:hypothetical protein [Gossypium aridum]
MFVWVTGYRRVEIENGNSAVVTVIQNGLAANSIDSELMDWEVKFRQILR